MKRGRSHSWDEDSCSSSKKFKPNGALVCDALEFADVRAVCGQCESVLSATALSNPTQCITEMIVSECSSSPSTPTNQKALIYAIGQGHVHCVKQLLKYCDEVNSAQFAGISPLHMCAGAGFVEVMEELIKHGADVNFPLPTDQLTPLHICAAFGSVECLKLLLDSGADPLKETSNSSMNAIHFAAYHGRVECIRLFLSYDYKVNVASTVSGRTPLHYAAVRGHVACFQYLLQNQADLTIVDVNDHSALVYAANGQQGLDIASHFSISERRKWLSVALVNVAQPAIEICSKRGKSIKEFKKHYSIIQQRIQQNNDFDRVPLFHFSFKNELGEGLGVVREWFSQLKDEIFNLNIFTDSYSGLYFAQQPTNNDIPQLLNAEILGTLLALGLIHGHVAPVRLSKPLFKLLLGEGLTIEDVAYVDYQFYTNQILYLRNCTVEELDALQLTFTFTESICGNHVDIDLKPNGNAILVTKDNLEEYIMLICNHKLFYQRKEYISKFIESFHRLIPVKILQKSFSVADLESIITGEISLSTDLWKQYTKYEKCDETTEQVQWFWQILESFTPDEQRAFLAFCTGSQSLPVGGFKQLCNDGMPFTIHLSATTQSLPSSRTCFNTLVLPSYANYEKLSSALHLIISIHVSQIGFGFV